MCRWMRLPLSWVGGSSSSRKAAEVSSWASVFRGELPGIHGCYRCGWQVGSMATSLPHVGDLPQLLRDDSEEWVIGSSGSGLCYCHKLAVGTYCQFTSMSRLEKNGEDTCGSSCCYLFGEHNSHDCIACRCCSFLALQLLQGKGRAQLSA